MRVLVLTLFLKTLIVLQEVDTAAGGLPDRLDPLRGDYRVQDIDLQARLRQLSALKERIDTSLGDRLAAPDFSDQFNKVCLHIWWFFTFQIYFFLFFPNSNQQGLAFFSSLCEQYSQCVLPPH